MSSPIPPNYKIVYHGPHLAGKATNLKYIHSQIDPTRRGEIIGLADEVVFFDFKPGDLWELLGPGDNYVRYSLYAKDGNQDVDHLILNGVDGIVFVADSDESRWQDNIDSFEKLKTALSVFGQSLESIPCVIQYNKRDLANAMPVERMERELNIRRDPSFEATASEGAGVVDTLVRLVRLMPIKPWH